jgi:hypothetical protein
MSVSIVGNSLDFRLLRNRLELDGVDVVGPEDECNALVLDRRSNPRQPASFMYDYSIVETMFSTLGLESSSDQRAGFWLIRMFDPKEGFSQQTFALIQGRGLLRNDEDSDVVVGGAGRYVRGRGVDELFRTPLMIYLQTAGYRGPVAIGISEVDFKPCAVRLDFPLQGMPLMLDGAGRHKDMFLEDWTQLRLFESWVLSCCLFREPWPLEMESGKEVEVLLEDFCLTRLWPMERVDVHPETGGRFKTTKSLFGVMVSFAGALGEASYHLSRLVRGVKVKGLQFRNPAQDIGDRWPAIVDFIQA